MLKFNNIIMKFGNNWLNIPEHNVITSGNHGTVTASPNKGIQGTEVTLSNSPDTGYEFSSYSVTGATLKNDNQFNIGTTDVNVNGNFTGIVRSVTTTSSPAAGGSVVASPSTGIIGTEITLSNTPAEGYNFNGYTISGATLSGNTFTIGESDVSVTGKFMVANGYYSGEATVGYYGNLAGNTVSGIPIVGNYNYYVPVKANLAGPYQSTGTLTYTIYQNRAFVFMNDNGADGITSLSLNFNESSALVIGDNTLNNLTSVTFNGFNKHNPLYIGNNSMNLTNTTQVNLQLSNYDQTPIYIGDGSCNNFNLSASGNTGPIKIGNNSLRTLTLKQDTAYYFSSGNFGAHLDVTPLLIPNADRLELHGDIKSMIQASMNARSSSVKVIYLGRGSPSIRCPDCSSSDISWLNNNKSSFVDGSYNYITFTN